MMIKLENVNKYFGDLHVLKDVSLTVKEGEKLVIIGPSGSGKSTTVRCMNFLEEPTSGHVYIAGKELTNRNKISIVRETTSMVFQQFNLYPHMTVMKNLTLAPMKLHHKSKQEAEKLAYHNIVPNLAKKESCIIVGRCADMLLKDYDRVLNIYIYAPYEARLKNCVDSLGMDEKTARSMIREVDRARELYRLRYCEGVREVFDHRDFMIDSSKYGPEKTSDILCAAARKALC